MAQRFSPWWKLRNRSPDKPLASEVLTSALVSSPPWTSYFVKYNSVINDQFGYSHFNWQCATGNNYHILRIGCYPYIKYHCSRRPYQDLSLENRLFTILKILNLGIPTLAYGVAAIFLIKHHKDVHTSHGSVRIFFLNQEDSSSQFWDISRIQQCD